MAQVTVTGQLRDYSDSSISNMRAWIHPVRPAVRTDGSLIFSDKPVEIDAATDGSFSHELESGHDYYLECVWIDPDRNRVGRSWWSDPFRIPDEDPVTLSAAMGQPAGAGWVRITDEEPTAADYMDHLVFDETTGDLYERVAS